jgi:3-hydroxy-9,10-secoandrosta-1,3,5(10)-triene-9,17-dione monooxygenase
MAGSISEFGDALHGPKLMQEARRLRPLFERNASLAEAKGELTPEVMQALTEIGALKMAAPKRWGGLCLSSRLMANVAAEISKGCPSTGWIVSIINSVAWMASKTTPEVQELLFKNGVPNMCGPNNGAGTLVPDGDAYRITGKWSYASASHHALWAMVPVVDTDGEPNLAFLPMSKITLENTWRMAGMKATGSDTVVAVNVRVQKNQFCKISDLSRPDPRFAEPTDYWVAFPLLRAKAFGVLIGIAEGLLEAVIATGSRPIIYTTYQHRFDSPVFLSVIGEVAAKIRAARTLMERGTDINDNAALQRTILTYEQRTELRGEGAVTSELLITSVDKLMNICGSSAFADSHPAQRYWRDFSVGARHIIFSSEVGYEVAGRARCNISPNIIVLEDWL